MTSRRKIEVRFPPEVKDFVEEQSALDGCSQNSVIVRAVREMKQRAELSSAALAAQAEARRRERAAEVKERKLEDHLRRHSAETSPSAG
jgi:Arc/MetJ-type ribon-helix-helix transcriptional regulator